MTLLVALGIAAAQGCQGPARGLGGTPSQTYDGAAVQPVRPYEDPGA